MVAEKQMEKKWHAGLRNCLESRKPGEQRCAWEVLVTWMAPASGRHEADLSSEPGRSQIRPWAARLLPGSVCIHVSRQRNAALCFASISK